MSIDTNTAPQKVLLIRGTVTVEVVPGVPDGYLAAAQKLVGADGTVGEESSGLG